MSLPTWESNIGYEEGKEWVISRLETGYPRFFIHPSVTALAVDIALAFGKTGQQVMLFATSKGALRCSNYIGEYALPEVAAGRRSIDFTLDASKVPTLPLKQVSLALHAVFFHPDAMKFAKEYWQHTGDGISSRKAEFCHFLVNHGILVPNEVVGQAQLWPQKGPRRYQSTSLARGSTPFTDESSTSPCQERNEDGNGFLEERFGRNLDISLTEPARMAIRRRIAGSIAANIDNNMSRDRDAQCVREEDVFLFPNGMNAIFHVHRTLLQAFGRHESISYGFPYVDTLKILQKFGPGCLFLGHGSSDELDGLEILLRSGRRYLALFCEFPGNPLLTCPDLRRIRKMADEFDFSVVVDETIGTFANVNVLPMADIVVSSLSKIFSGDSNVMGGSAIINPRSKHHLLLQRVMREDIYENAYWNEDVIFMERNSRDFLGRVNRINANAEAICQVLCQSSAVKNLYYPLFNASKHFYDEYRLPHGGYGGLISVVFCYRKQAEAFFNTINIAKGPSLGTNFTLCSPYVLLAHYHESAWAAKYGVHKDLVRISVGLEQAEGLKLLFQNALSEAEKV